MNRNILSFRFKNLIAFFQHPSQRIRFLILSFYCFSFLNCITMELIKIQKETSFYESVNPPLDQLRLLQNEKRPILELSYIADGKPKFHYYCADASSAIGNSNKEYSYDIRRLKLDDECDWKGGDADISRIRVENPSRKLFLPDIGTAIVLPWQHSIITIYEGPPIRKTISDIQKAWTVGWGSDERLCLSDSKNRILVLDCTKFDGGSYFRRNVCIQTSADCSQPPTSKLLSLSEIPRTPPTYFIAEGWGAWGEKDRKTGKTASLTMAIAVWLYESKSTRKGSSIVEIEFFPEIKQFSPRNAIAYGMCWLLLPFTLAIDIVALIIEGYFYYMKH
ncbi:hypothetical protein KQY10_06820 [Leptospira interrogans]|uniref:Uncharacterized protein n=2 Tax=Leptospira interrogans TaxID=173 RepID=A0AAP9WD24_LEPIR|nr:hypothetical protein [Leptospira interrogans]ALE40629.1 hypothetical protein G436_3479 [Leptospira interrogans serovar Hardjo str. Norma]ALN99673.1 hypothetical protein LIH_04800 [Leptospira interrogans serovar Hardjo-prajitno]EKO96587.1 hypothetical protein LEP1GSC057_4205 [Leptospira interrogans str. Brem 329]MCD1165326.1 hypothetical protein [Leptospira interrogans]MCH1903826.1 hypothetical protein [Leptospira interrogans]